MAIADKCTTCANAAYAAYAAAPTGYYLTLFVNGQWVLDRTKNFAPYTVLAQLPSGNSYANAAALSTALQGVASDPQPATAPYREGQTPV
jgi:hypothetical protein